MRWCRFVAVVLSGDDFAVLHGDGDLRQGLGGGALDDLAGEGVVPRAVAGAVQFGAVGCDRAAHVRADRAERDRFAVEGGGTGTRQ